MDQTKNFCLYWPPAGVTSKLFKSQGIDEMPSLTTKHSDGQFSPS
jgi:hypothetical protein